MTDQMTIINSFRRLLFGQQGRYERQFLLDTGTLIHILGAVNIPFDALVSSAANVAQCRSLRFDGQHYTALYIEWPDTWMLFFQPYGARCDLGQFNFNQSVDANLTADLLTFGKLHVIKNLEHTYFSIFFSLFDIYGRCLSYIYTLDIEMINRIKSINTCKEIRKNFFEAKKSCLNSIANYAEEFALIYYFQIAAVECYSTRKHINWHDVATNSGNLPILLHHLSQSKTLEFTLAAIVASDIDLSPANHSWNHVKALFDSETYWCVKRLDLYADLRELHNADVVTANDVLEHFDEQEAFHIFKSLWVNTKDLLLIHVPIEEKLSIHFGHKTQFTRQKLHEWASSLDMCQNLTDEFVSSLAFGEKKWFEGFLILKKVLPVLMLENTSAAQLKEE